MPGPRHRPGQGNGTGTSSRTDGSLDTDPGGRGGGACRALPLSGAPSGDLAVLSESFTPDHKPLMGEAPELRGFFLGCGFNSAGECGEQGARSGRVWAAHQVGDCSSPPLQG